MLLKEAREQGDAGLVEGSLRGDPGAFDELVRRYKDRLYGVLFRYADNHEDALELAQEVFLRAHRGLHAYHGQAQVCTWLYSIAVSIARNRIRDRKSRRRTPADTARERDADLEACLADLPDTYRLAFCMKTFDGLRHDEIALALGCPATTVKSRLNEARRRLHASLHARGVL